MLSFSVLLSRFSICLCVCIHVHTSLQMRAGAHTQVNMCAEATGRFKCHSSDTTHFFWKQCLSLAWNSPIGLGRLTSEPPVPASQGWDFKCPLPCPGQLLLVFTWGVGIKFRSLCKANISLAELSPQSQNAFKEGRGRSWRDGSVVKGEYLGAVPSPGTVACSCLLLRF